MPASNESVRREALSYLETRFGVSPAAFDKAVFFGPADGEVWVASAGALGRLPSRRSPGLRALRRTPAGLKPTSSFLVSIGPFVTASRLALDRDALRQILLGRRIPSPVDDGYVAVALGDLVLGCGLAADGNAHCLIPTARRRDLLSILDA